MKRAFLFSSLILLISSCAEEREPINSKRMINDIRIEKSELCDNELDLISFSINNWEIAVDTIANITQYRTIQKQAIADYYVSEEGMKHLDEKHPRLYPFLKVNDIDVSMMRFLMPVRGGYRMHPEELMWVRYRSEEKYEGGQVAQRVFQFYTNFELGKEKADYDPMAIRGPVVNLTLVEGEFSQCVRMLEDISEGYLVAMQSEAIERYDENLCNLDPAQLGKLKKDLPFQVRIFKDKSRRAY